jgi:CHAT domain-containing protein/Tfp pilus assembly protein PilF
MRPIVIILLIHVFFTGNGQMLTTTLHHVDSLMIESRYKEARELIERSLATPAAGEERFLLLNKKAEALLADGQLEEAFVTIEQIKAEKPVAHREQAMLLTNIGSYEMNRGRFDLALEALNAAYLLYQGKAATDVSGQARCVGLISLSYLATGKYQLAEENALVALQLRRSQYGDAHEVVAASYNDLGLVYTSVDPDKALEYYEMALETYKRLHGPLHPKIAIASTNIGILYGQLELYGDATNNLEAALAIWKAAYPSGHPNEAFVRRNLGQIYFSMGKVDVALEYFQQALDLYRKSYGEKHPEISSTLNQMGVAQLEKREYEAALHHFQKAICANIAGFNELSLETNPPIDDYYNGTVLLYSLRLKAQGLEDLHFGKTLKMTHLALAQATLYLCDSLIDDLRHHSTDEADKITLGSLASDVYEDGVRTSMALSEISVRPRTYVEAAFYFAEKSKSAVLQESIADTQAKSFAGIPSALVDEEKNLKSGISLLSQKLSQKPSAEEEKYLREALVALKHEYTTFTRKLETEYPDYYNLKFNVASPTVEGLQALLDEKEALVSYFIAARAKRLYQFVITSKSFKAFSNSIPSDFDRSTRGFNNGIFYRDFSTYSKSTSMLYNVLRPRVPRKIEEIVILPAGRLGTLPFEALALNAGKADSFQSCEYLAQRYAISYEFSTGLIAQKKKNKEISAPSIFLCAPVTFPSKRQLGALPGTEQEVKEIDALFGSLEKKTLTREEANEAAVKGSDISDYRFLHFATHGIVDEEDPEKSRIFLNEYAGEDGDLFASEIYNLSLNADLAVLSACQTGLGKYSEGEGVIGLSRALVYAGARNLIVSFWSVADESTAHLMTQFYSDLVKNGSADYRKSLQRAKTSMINGAYNEPYYWAPFIMIGF